MKYKTESLAKYLDDLSARLPAPGGGSAAAMNAAMAASLMSMAVNFTLGKPEYFKYAAELKTALEKTNKLKNDFLDLVDLDVAAYTSGDLRKAADVPLTLARLCFEGAKILPFLIKRTNPKLSSDLAVAAIFFESAFSAARFNIAINLKMLNDCKLEGAINKELRLKEKSVKKARVFTEESVGKIIRG